jgi:hypothetical protein
MDVAIGGLGILLHLDSPLAVGHQVALWLPVKPYGYRLFRMEVRWRKVGELFVTAGLAFF